MLEPADGAASRLFSTCTDKLNLRLGVGRLDNLMGLQYYDPANIPTMLKSIKCYVARHHTPSIVPITLDSPQDSPVECRYQTVTASGEPAFASGANSLKIQTFGDLRL